MRGWAALARALGLSPRRAQAVGARGRARVMGADETAVRVNGEKTVVGVVTDSETGQVPGLEVLVERDSDGFMEWLCDFARDYGVEAPVVERLVIERQICVARVRNRARSRLDRIEG